MAQPTLPRLCSPLPYKYNSLWPNIKFIEVRGVSYSGPNFGLIYIFCFSRKKLTMLRSTCLSQWATLRSPNPPAGQSTGQSLREPAAGNLSSSFRCVTGVNIWPRIILSQNSTLSDTAIFFIYSTIIFSFLGLAQWIKLFWSRSSVLLRHIWIYSHRFLL